MHRPRLIEASRLARWLVLPIAASCAFDTSGVGTGAAPIDGGEFDASAPDAPAPDDASETDDASVDATTDASVDAPVDATIDASVDAPLDTGPDTNQPDSGPAGTIVAASVLGATIDRVSPADQGLTTDGQVDGTFEVTLVGPVDALILVTTSGAGAAAGNSQWDTLVLGDALPSIGTTFTSGSQTWILGVYEGVTRINDAAGRIALGAGLHTLTLYGANNGTQVSGQHFRVYTHTNGGMWQAGPVVKW